MESCLLRITLLSDACFSRGDGVAGIIDREIQHDELGYPYLSGKEIKGILVNECADILSAIPGDKRSYWEEVADKIFGRSGGNLKGGGILSIGPARIPADLNEYLTELREWEIFQKLKGDFLQPNYEANRQKLEDEFRVRILNCLTGLRQQTSIGDDGVQKEHSLRTSRVILRNCIFESELNLLNEKEDNSACWALLSACVLSFRRAGASRNRGFGKLIADLISQENKSFTLESFRFFKESLSKGVQS